VLPNADAKTPDEAKLPDYKPSAALVRAQQYIRGKGAPQNCEQGLLYLKAATDKSDPGAAIQMAALYSSGLCVKQDRVMAYRWFNSAHELQPANMWIQKNMDQLWAQMSSQERRLAGY
jgi:TPR repeat protein